MVELNLTQPYSEQLEKIIKDLRKENKELNNQIEQFKKGVKSGTEIIERLEEERDLYKSRNEELNENCFGLAKENKELKKKLDILYHQV